VAAAVQTTNRSRIRETDDRALTRRRPMTEAVHTAGISRVREDARTECPERFPLVWKPL
jgi:hypothetical protein